MKRNDRENRIISILDARREISVAQLSSELDISPSTLRKQLSEMYEKHLVIRTYGGVMSVNPVKDESFDSKIHKNVAEKRRIAEAARRFIHGGDMIALGSGTTIYALSNIMDDLSSSKVYTNSMQAAEYLSRSPMLEIHLCGGIIRNHTGTIIGNEVSSFFGKLELDAAFIGCDALDAEGNVYSDNMAAAASERAVIKNAKKVYVLCDSSKIGKRSVARITTLAECTALITGSVGLPTADKLKYISNVMYV